MSDVLVSSHHLMIRQSELRMLRVIIRKTVCHRFLSHKCTPYHFFFLAGFRGCQMDEFDESQCDIEKKIQALNAYFKEIAEVPSLQYQRVIASRPNDSEEGTSPPLEHTRSYVKCTLELPVQMGHRTEPKVYVLLEGLALTKEAAKTKALLRAAEIIQQNKKAVDESVLQPQNKQWERLGRAAQCLLCLVALETLCVCLLSMAPLLRHHPIDWRSVGPWQAGSALLGAQLVLASVFYLTLLWQGLRTENKHKLGCFLLMRSVSSLSLLLYVLLARSNRPFAPRHAAMLAYVCLNLIYVPLFVAAKPRFGWKALKSAGSDVQRLQHFQQASSFSAFLLLSLCYGLCMACLLLLRALAPLSVLTRFWAVLGLSRLALSVLSYLFGLFITEARLTRASNHTHLYCWWLVLEATYLSCTMSWVYKHVHRSEGHGYIALASILGAMDLATSLLLLVHCLTQPCRVAGVQLESASQSLVAPLLSAHDSTASSRFLHDHSPNSSDMHDGPVEPEMELQSPEQVEEPPSEMEGNTPHTPGTEQDHLHNHGSPYGYYEYK
eukprot:g78824.t1